MTTILALLITLSIIVFIIGMIKPRLVVRWGKKRTRKEAATIYGGLVIVFFISFSILSGKGNIIPEKHLFPIVKDLKWGYINETGKVIIPPKFLSAGEFASGLAPVFINKKMGYIDYSGKVVIEPEYNLASEFDEGLALVMFKNKAGFIDSTGKLVIDPQSYISALTSFSEGLAAVIVDEPGEERGRFGFMNKQGEMVIDARFDDIRGPEDHPTKAFFEDLACVKKDGLFGYINHSGRFEIKPQFSNASIFSEGLAAVAVDYKAGYINKFGKFAIEPKFDGAKDFSGGLAAVMIEDKWGYINKSGDLVILPQYDLAMNFKDGLARVFAGKFGDGKWGFIDTTGNKVFDFKFDGASDFKNGLSKVRFGKLIEGKWGYMNKKGNLVWKSGKKNEW